MGIIVLLAKQIGRPAKVKNILALTATLMLAQNPLILTTDVGFQLSFLATIGLIYLSEKIKPYFQKIPTFFSLQENLVSTLSATILTAPLIIYHFGRISLIAPLTNILILPAIPLAMLLGFIQVILGMLYLPLGTIAGYLTYAVLQYIILIVNSLTQLSFASLDL
jgi:competence protein ComEC